MKKKLYDDQLIIITGAAGFIGSGVVRYLNDLGYSNLLLVDDLYETDKWKNLLGKQFIDFISKQDLFHFLEGRESEIEAFIHLGACSDTTEKDGDYLMDNNYRYSVGLAEYALTHGHRFIYASSAATYGDGTHGFSDDEEKLDDLRPLNLYAYSKHLFDLWVKRQGAFKEVVGLKYFNIFGPNEYHKGRMASMVCQMTEQILQTGKVRLFCSTDPKYKDGEQIRDFFYVKDAVAMTCSFLKNDLTGLFNVGKGEGKTWNELAKAIFHALDKPVQIEYFSMPEKLQSCYQNYTCAEMKKYRNLLKEQGIKEEKTYSIEDGISDYVTNYLLGEHRW